MRRPSTQESKDSNHAILTGEHGHLIKLLTGLLEGENAHITFDKAVKDIPSKYYGIVPEGLPYSLWQLVEHIRIAQYDILEFSRNPDYQSPSWPDGYWPESAEPPENTSWEDSLVKYRKDRAAFISLLKNPEVDLYKPFPHGNGQNLVREAMLIADHTAYHTGQIIIIRRMLGIYT